MLAIPRSYPEQQPAVVQLLLQTAGVMIADKLGQRGAEPAQSNDSNFSHGNAR